MFKSNYITAGNSTTAGILFRQNFDSDEVNNFLKKNIKGVMSCFGNSIGSKDTSKDIQKFSKSLNKNHSTNFFRDIEYYIDSGGFQVMTGKLDKNKTEDLIINYHNFLQEHFNLYTKAFMLDLPMNNTLYNSWDDLYKYNKRTINMALDLPSKIKDKMIYVHHFGVKRTADTFKKLFNEFDLFNQFKNFAVGGVVNTRFSATTPYRAYTIPIIFYLNKVIKNKMKDFTIHFLGVGAASYKLALYYKLIEHHVKKVFDINLEITHDSCMFHRIGRAKKFTFINNDNKINQFEFYTKNLDKRIQGRKYEDIVKDKLKEFSIRNNFDYGHDMTIYDKDNDYKTNMKTYAYMILHDIWTVNKLFKEIYDFIPELYEKYENKDRNEFNNQLREYTKGMYNDKYTKSIKNFCNDIWLCLDIITNLDEKYSDYLLNSCSNTPDYFNEKGVLTL